MDGDGRSDLDRLKSVIAEHTGHTVDLVERVDEDLLGGLIVAIGDNKFDMSVATQLRRVGSALQERASREIHAGRTLVEESAG